MLDRPSERLHRYTVLRVTCPDELRHIAAKALGAARLETWGETNGFAARVNMIDLDEIGLAFGSTSCDLAADQNAVDCVRLKIALKAGAAISVGGTTTDLNEQQHVVTGAGVASQMVCQGGHERLTLRLKQDALVQRLGSMLGIRPKGELRFDAAMPAADPRARSLVRLLDFISRQLDSDSVTLPPAVYRELEQAVQIAFLLTARHSFSHLLEQPANEATHALVIRIEEFIESNWREELSIERLVTESGVSARTLFRTFARIRGYSPMSFLRIVRLRRARDLLLSGHPDISVATAATTCNFANQGHFARHYRAAFGELPSQTLAKVVR